MRFGFVCPSFQGIVTRTPARPRSRYFATSPSGRASHFTWSSSTPTRKVEEGRSEVEYEPALPATSIAACRASTDEVGTPGFYARGISLHPLTEIIGNYELTSGC